MTYQSSTQYINRLFQLQSNAFIYFNHFIVFTFTVFLLFFLSLSFFFFFLTEVSDSYQQLLENGRIRSLYSLAI